MDNINFVTANKDDSLFIAKATLLAERAHTGIGIWDLLLGDKENGLDPKALECLQYVIENDTKSHLYYKNFTLAKTKDHNKSVASISSYSFPDYSLDATFDALKLSTNKVAGWSFELFDQHKDKINFMNELPSDLPYNESWMIEAVYTDEDYRGIGISSKLMKDSLIKGKHNNCPRSMIIVALGNEKAKSIYTKCGFKDIGIMESESCFAQMGSLGFDIMGIDF